jgi:hypothetical protein
MGIPLAKTIMWFAKVSVDRYDAAMFKRKNLEASLNGLEIGATGPGTVQFVLDANGRKVTVKMTAAEARWLAYALGHWADSSDTISVQ